MAEFENPPVVEIWVSFEFEPNEDKRTWDLALVKKFVEHHSKEFPKLEQVQEKTVEIKETSPNDLQIVGHEMRLERVRLTSEDQSRAIQLGDDTLSVHILRTPQCSPLFGDLRIASRQKVQDYINIFEPNAIRHAALHYVDIINIPRPESGKINLDEFFVGCPDLPEEPFGTISNFALNYQIACMVDPGPLVLQLGTVPSSLDDGVFRFRMDWHKRADKIDSLDLSDIWDRIESVDGYVNECFVSALTQKTLDLFGPVTEN